MGSPKPETNLRALFAAIDSARTLRIASIRYDFRKESLEIRMEEAGDPNAPAISMTVDEWFASQADAAAQGNTQSHETPIKRR